MKKHKLKFSNEDLSFNLKLVKENGELYIIYKCHITAIKWHLRVKKQIFTLAFNNEYSDEKKVKNEWLWRQKNTKITSKWQYNFIENFTAVCKKQYKKNESISKNVIFYLVIC